jgi:hypothetical protein
MSDRQDTTPGHSPMPPQGPAQPAGAAAAGPPAVSAGPPAVSAGPPAHAAGTQPGHDAPVTQRPPEGSTAVGPHTGTAPATAPDYSPRPIAVRRPDTLAALLLLLAGLAGGVSLLLRWLADDDATGLDLVRRGFDEVGQRVGEVFDTGFWQPVTVVLGGAVLFLLGLVLFVPARRHRFVGALALIVSLLVTAAVLIPLAEAGWDLSEFDVGFWFAIAVAVLGLIGSVKALLTGRRYANDANRG